MPSPEITAARLAAAEARERVRTAETEIDGILSSSPLAQSAQLSWRQSTPSPRRQKMQSGWASTLGAAESDAARNSASAVDSACMPQVNSTPSVLPHPPARAPPESVTHINGDRGTDLDCAAHRVRPQSAEPASLQSVGARSSFEVNDELMNTQKQLQESQALLAASLENARLWRDQYDGLHRKFEALRKDYEALQQQREPSEPIGNQSPKSPPVLRKQLTMEGMGFVPNNSTVLRRRPGEQIVPKALQRLGRYVMARSVVAYLRQQTLRKAMMNRHYAI